MDKLNKIIDLTFNAIGILSFSLMMIFPIACILIASYGQ